MQYPDQTDPRRDPQSARDGNRRDPFFRATPIDLDRRADRELALGRALIAERLSHAAAAMREAAR